MERKQGYGKGRDDLLRICVIQPPYGFEETEADRYFQYKMDRLDACDENIDLIVLPEYSDVPYSEDDMARAFALHDRYYGRLMEKCRETAVRCGAAVFVNAFDRVDGQYRNTTFAYAKNGELAGKYYKRHIPPGERDIRVAYDYTLQRDDVYTLMLDGVKYAFLTCYDFYFYEYFPRIARENVDVIIGCSLQRSDTHEALEICCRFLAYQTNAYVIRSSVSFAEDSPVCGSSMVVAPDGKVLVNQRARFGSAVAEIDPHQKYYKPAGFGRPKAAHWQYMEEGRTPWNYRQCGSAICLSDSEMPYPRVCAHRGFNTVAPENSLPAYGAAVALGSDEIEFDLWATKDGELVSSHDPGLERVSDGKGCIWDYTLDELKKLDFGVKSGEAFTGLQIVRFEEILQRFACHTIMNIHVKIWDAEWETDYLEKIVSLIRRYECEKYVYFMSSSDRMLRKAGDYAPDIRRCVGYDNSGLYERIVERAIALGAEKVQLFRPYFDRETVQLAHQNGIRCNVFWSDDEESTKEYIQMGIDTILTNDFNRTDCLLRKICEDYRCRKEGR